MFGLFKKTTEAEKLQKRYEQLMKEWHKLSTVNRGKSDEKYAEAQAIQEKLEQLKG